MNMPLVPMKAILDTVYSHQYAAGAFNVNTASQAEALIGVHEMFRAPAIVQGAELANGFMGGCADFAHSTPGQKRTGAANIAKAVKARANDGTVPVALHLDHGKSLESVKAAVEGGYTSVMIDGSSLPLEDNIALTREVVKYAHPRGVTVEGELGVLAGIEDHVFGAQSTYTHPLDAIRLFKATGVDCLAVSYGTMHGACKGKNVKLRREIVIAIRECMLHEGIDGVLVSHGSSTVPKYIVDELNQLGGRLTDVGGIPIGELKASIACGIGKINVDTDIRLAVTRNLRELFEKYSWLKTDASTRGVYALLEQLPEAVDPRCFLSPVMELVMYGTASTNALRLLDDSIRRGVEEVAGTLIVSFGMVGKSAVVKPLSLEEMADHYRKQGI